MKSKETEVLRPKDHKENETELKNKYNDLMNQYISISGEIKKLERKTAYQKNEKIIIETDKKRHHIHLKLEEAGEKIGKNKADITIDILLKEGNSIEYGLDAPIIAPEDNKIKNIKRSLEKRGIDINKPKNGLEVLTILHNIQDIQPIYNDEVIIVFGVEENIDKIKEGVSDYFDKYSSSGIGFSASFSKKMKSLKRISRDFPETRTFGSGVLFHHNTKRIYGLAVKKSDVLRIINEIRNNKEKYWVTEEQEHKEKGAYYETWKEGDDGHKHFEIKEHDEIPVELLESNQLSGKIGDLKKTNEFIAKRFATILSSLRK